jgi:hypothetical protein
LQGIRNSGVPKHIFQHNDPLDLEKKLQKVSCQLLPLAGRHISLVPIVKGTVPRDVQLQVFSGIRFPQAPGVFHSGRFEFFKIAEIFAAEGAPPVSLTPVANGKNPQSEQ